MLRHMNLTDKADLIENSVFAVLKMGEVRTADIGGTSSCTEYTDAIIREMDAARACS
jgi:isocitrate dehydrogenase (NAD+)